jgi:hypothetical protein
MWINMEGMDWFETSLSQIMANRIYTRIMRLYFTLSKTRYLKLSELKKDDYILKKNYRYLLASSEKISGFFYTIFKDQEQKPAEELM